MKTKISSLSKRKLRRSRRRVLDDKPLETPLLSPSDAFVPPIGKSVGMIGLALRRNPNEFIPFSVIEEVSNLFRSFAKRLPRQPFIKVGNKKIPIKTAREILRNNNIDTVKEGRRFKNITDEVVEVSAKRGGVSNRAEAIKDLQDTMAARAARIIDRAGVGNRKLINNVAGLINEVSNRGISKPKAKVLLKDMLSEVGTFVEKKNIVKAAKRVADRRKR